MKNYQHGKIYIIRSPHTEDVYIGSSIQPLSVRMGKHRDMSNDCRSASIILAGDSYIELLEIWACNTVEELRAREGHHIRITPNCINRNIAGRSRKQYYQDNVEKTKQYYQNNAEKICENQKQYYKQNANKLNTKNNCVCGGKFTTSNKAQHENTLKHITYIHQMKLTK